VTNVEREDIEFYCKSLGCKPIASIDHFTPEMLGTAELVEEVQAGSGKIVKVSQGLMSWGLRGVYGCSILLSVRSLASELVRGLV
jgi:hypothetical protein